MPASDRRITKHAAEQEQLVGRVLAMLAVSLLVPTVLLIEKARGEPLPLVAGLIVTTILAVLVAARYAFFFHVFRLAANRERALRQELDEQNEELREINRIIVRNSHRLTRLIEDILFADAGRLSLERQTLTSETSLPPRSSPLGLPPRRAAACGWGCGWSRISRRISADPTSGSRSSWTTVISNGSCARAPPGGEGHGDRVALRR